MLTIRRLRMPPDNFSIFVEEMASGLRGLYGPVAEAGYRSTIEAQFGATLAHPSIYAFGAYVQEEAAALALAQMQSESRARITLIHVLSHCVGQGVERALLAELVQTLKDAGISKISADYVPLGPQDLSAKFAELDFAHTPRRIMGSGIETLVASPESPIRSAPLKEEEYETAADILFQAYRNHPDTAFQPELQSNSECRSLVQSIALGAFGPAPCEYLRLVRHAEIPVALALSSAVAPDTGFLLHLAVVPNAQRQGIGATLIRDVAVAQKEAGIAKLALGVSDENPARGLYERLGFEDWRALNTYVWQQE